MRHFYAKGQYFYDGASCQVGATKNLPSASTNPGYGTDGTNPPKCKPGEMGGYVNNRPVCLSGSGTPKTVTPTSDPSKSVDASGNPSGGDSANPDPDSIDGVCKANPNQPLCKDGSDVSSRDGSGGGTGSGTGGGTGTNNDVCPQCATEATLQATKASVDAQKGILEKIRDFLDPKGEDGKGVANDAPKADDTYKPVEDGIHTAQSNPTSFGGLHWEFDPLLPSGGACEAPSISILKVDVRLDYCGFISIVRGVLGWLAYVSTAMAIFQVVTSKKEGGK